MRLVLEFALIAFKSDEAKPYPNFMQINELRNKQIRENSHEIEVENFKDKEFVCILIEAMYTIIQNDSFKDERDFYDKL